MMTNEQFTCYAEKYIDTVFRVAYNYLKSSTDADDITQNVFLKLFRYKKDFENEGHLKNWLIRVTINECHDLTRSRWWKAESVEDYAGTLTFESKEQSELFQMVMELPKKYRLPIYLYYYEGYATSEIGEILHLPKNTICSQLKRGRELLKFAIEEA